MVTFMLLTVSERLGSDCNHAVVPCVSGARGRRYPQTGPLVYRSENPGECVLRLPDIPCNENDSMEQPNSQIVEEGRLCT